MTRHVVGVDGGGTRTRAALVDGGGRGLATAEGPASLVDPARPEAAAGVVAGLVLETARGAGVTPPVDVVWAAIAGAGLEVVRSAVEGALEREGVARRVRVGTDVQAAFRDVFGAGPGILVVAGTGSVAWGRSPDGREARVGGWGSVLGDEGSGYWIGREALGRIARGADGRGPGTALGGAVLDELGLSGVEDLAAWARGADKAALASLVPTVVARAREGDAVAGEILARAVEELAVHVRVLGSRLGPWPGAPPVGFAGGLLRPGGPVREALERALPRDHFGRADREPDAVRGAVELALAL